MLPCSANGHPESRQGKQIMRSVVRASRKNGFHKDRKQWGFTNQHYLPLIGWCFISSLPLSTRSNVHLSISIPSIIITDITHTYTRQCPLPHPPAHPCCSSIDLPNSLRNVASLRLPPHRQVVQRSQNPPALGQRSAQVSETKAPQTLSRFSTLLDRAYWVGQLHSRCRLPLATLACVIHPYQTSHTSMTWPVHRMRLPISMSPRPPMAPTTMARLIGLRSPMHLDVKSQTAAVDSSPSSRKERSVRRCQKNNGR